MSLNESPFMRIKKYYGTVLVDSNKREYIDETTIQTKPKNIKKMYAGDTILEEGISGLDFTRVQRYYGEVLVDTSGREYIEVYKGPIGPTGPNPKLI